MLEKMVPQPQSGYFILFTVCAAALCGAVRERGGNYVCMILLCVYGTLSSLKYVKTRGRDPKYIKTRGRDPKYIKASYGTVMAGPWSKICKN